MNKSIRMMLAMALAGCTVACASGKSGKDDGERRVTIASTTVISGSKGKQQTATQQYSLRDFTAICASGVFEVEYVQGDNWQVTVETDANKLDRIDLRVEHATLLIGTQKGRRNVSFSRTPRVIVTSPRLNSVETRGACGFHSQRVKADRFDLTTSGSSRIHIDEMQVGAFKGKCSGASDIDATVTATSFEMKASGSVDGRLTVKADDMSLKASGASDLKVVFVGKRGEVICSGAGDINLHADCEFLHARNSGAADFKIAGVADETKIEASGAADIDTRELNNF